MFINYCRAFISTHHQCFAIFSRILESTGYTFYWMLWLDCYIFIIFHYWIIHIAHRMIRKVEWNYMAKAKQSGACLYFFFVFVFVSWVALCFVFLSGWKFQLLNCNLISIWHQMMYRQVIKNTNNNQMDACICLCVCLLRHNFVCPKFLQFAEYSVDNVV